MTTGQHQAAGSLQRNVREYYNDFKLLRADSQVGCQCGAGDAGAVAGLWRDCGGKQWVWQAAHV
jgi:hypothetical protein